MQTTHHIRPPSSVLCPLLSALCLLALSALQPFSPSALSQTSPDKAVVQEIVGRTLVTQTGGLYEVVSFAPNMAVADVADNTGRAVAKKCTLGLTAKTTKPLYIDIPVYSFAEHLMKVDIKPLLEARQLLSGADGNLIRAKAPDDARKVESVQTMRLVAPSAPAGAQIEFEAEVLAAFVDNQWRMIVRSLTPRSNPVEGQPLEARGNGPVYDVMKGSDAIVVRDSINQGVESARRILQLGKPPTPATAPPATAAVAQTAPGSAGVPPADVGRPDPRPIQNPKSQIQNPKSTSSPSIPGSAGVPPADEGRPDPRPTQNPKSKTQNPKSSAAHISTGSGMAEIAAHPDWNIPGIPPLPVIIPYYDVKAYAWVWDGREWQHIHRNETRILHRPKEKDSGSKQLVGTLWIDGTFALPAVSGQNVILLFRMETEFKRFKGLPENETGFEVVKLDVKDGPRKGQLIRTAQLQRLGEAAATFGAKREPITVQKLVRQDGVFHSVQVNRPLAPGRYALYLPDRAFEFAVR